MKTTFFFKYPPAFILVHDPIFEFSYYVSTSSQLPSSHIKYKYISGIMQLVHKFVFCCGLVLFSFTPILQGYFIGAEEIMPQSAPME